MQKVTSGANRNVTKEPISPLPQIFVHKRHTLPNRHMWYTYTKNVDKQQNFRNLWSFKLNFLLIIIS